MFFLRSFCFRSIFMFALLLFLTSGWVSNALGELSHEYEIKIAFIYNIAKYVEWPNDSFKHKDDPLVLVILGDNPFTNHLDKISGKPVHNRQLLIREITDKQEIPPCHILYISNSEKNNAKKIISKLADQPILTIAAQKHFINAGGMINLIKQKNKIRFIINPQRAKNSGLSISSRLLKLANVSYEFFFYLLYGVIVEKIIFNKMRMRFKAKIKL